MIEDGERPRDETLRPWWEDDPTSHLDPDELVPGWRDIAFRSFDDEREHWFALEVDEADQQTWQARRRPRLVRLVSMVVALALLVGAASGGIAVLIGAHHHPQHQPPVSTDINP